MAQGKKATSGSKGAVKKVADRVKSAVGAAKKKLVPKKAAAPAKAAAKPSPKKVAKPAPKKAPAKPAVKPAPKPAPKAVAKKPAPKPVKPAPKAAAKPAPKKVAKAPIKAAKAVTKAVKAAPKAVAKVKAAASVVKTAVAKVVAKPAPKPAKAPAKIETAKPAKALPKAVPVKPPEKKAAPSTPAVPAAPPAPAAAVKPAADEKAKRGRRARPRVTSSGAPAASWLTTEKPRAASFIPAPPRAEAPSAIAAPPASSDRLLRPEDVVDMAVRTVPVRVDVEQGAGRFYVHANPLEIFLRVGEGIEWDFRYLGGADVSCEEVVVEFEKPSPFVLTVFRTRKPGGARPHRQMSGPALPGSVGQHVAYMIRANTGFKTELANAKVWLTVTA
jgi:hypothetical protein